MMEKRSNRRWERLRTPKAHEAAKPLSPRRADAHHGQEQQQCSTNRSDIRSQSHPFAKSQLALANREESIYGVKEYVTNSEGRLTLHFLPGYAPDLNPDELVWSHAKRTGVARKPLMKGEKLQKRVHEQLQKISENKKLVRSFFKHPSVAYISDC